VIDGEVAGGEVRWYNRSRLNYAGASMIDVAWSDITTDGHPFFEMAVYDHVHTLLLPGRTSLPAAAAQTMTLKTSKGLH